LKKGKKEKKRPVFYGKQQDMPTYRCPTGICGLDLKKKGKKKGKEKKRPVFYGKQQDMPA